MPKQIRILVSMGGPDFAYGEGDEVVVDNKQADYLIALGRAELMKDLTKKKAKKKSG